MKICKNCVYYKQHYIYTERRLRVIDCGHCIAKRLKKNPVPCNSYEENPEEIKDLEVISLAQREIKIIINRLNGLDEQLSKL